MIRGMIITITTTTIYIIVIITDDGTDGEKRGRDCPHITDNNKQSIQ